ncbi:putative ABC transporter ATP-binding protein [bacterium BMS3Abin05]|nr:putative ABC transporter ATP-binding protein [bacterium BMS3Abin05]GBE28633.1 putative ABC transporter ATP-binding protein [bacterium BMS3Bbin03]
MKDSGHTFIEEDVVGKAYDRKIVGRLIHYVHPYRWQAAAAVILLIVVSLLQLAGPLFTKIAIDRYITPGDLTGLFRISMFFLLVLVLEFIFYVIEINLMEWIGQHIMFDLRTETFSHLQKMDIAFFDRNPVGRLVTRVSTDVAALQQVFTSGIIAIFGDLFTLLGIVIVLLSLNWRLALVTFSVFPLLFYVTFLFRRKVRDSYRKIRYLIARLNVFLQENISGMVIVQLFNRVQKNFEEFKKLNEETLRTHLKTVFYFTLFGPSVDMISYFAIALIIWFGGIRYNAGGLTLGILIAFIQYAQRFFRPISDLAEKYNILQSAMASSERIFKILDENEKIASPPRPVSFKHLMRGIRFDHVWFAYKDEDWVLKDVSFTVEKGQKVAIVGATGAGKTSIISLLARFYDVRRGAITIDGTDIRRFPVKELRRKIAIVLQDVFLFSGSVADNIRLGEDLSEETVVEAARVANAHAFVQALPGGYFTDIKERGQSLSLGQRQLLSFARALAFNPEILVLDEATSSVDTHTELLIQKALERLLKNRTAIIIAHRLSTIQRADKIFVIHKGEIRESGTHKELLSLKGIYYRLYKLQFEEQQAKYAVG